MRQNSDYSSYSYDCYGSITEGDVTIRCFDSTVHGLQDLRQAFANSCNSAFSNIGLGLDISGYRDTAEDLLFNSELPVCLTIQRAPLRWMRILIQQRS